MCVWVDLSLSLVPQVQRMQSKWLDRAEGMLLSRQAAGFNAMQHAVGGIVAAGMAEGEEGD